MDAVAVSAVLYSVDDLLYVVASASSGGCHYDTRRAHGARQCVAVRFCGLRGLAMPIGGFLLLIQGLPEIFRAFHKMGKERERKFVMAPAVPI